MSVSVHIVKSLDATLTVKKVEILGDKEYRVKYDDNGTEKIVKFDFTGFDGDRIRKVNVGHDEVVWRFRNKTIPEVHFAVWGDYAEDVIEDSIVSSYPHYAFLASGESRTAETETATYAATSLTFAEKRTRENQALRKWKRYMEATMSEASRLSYYSSTLFDNVGKLLRSMDQYIKDESQNSATDPLVVAKLAETAVKGPFGIELIRNQIRGMDGVSFHATRTQSWVRKGPSNDRENIAHRRLENLALGPAGSPLDDDHDAIDREWIKDNRDGEVTIDSMAPVQGTSVRATISDPDGGIGGRTYQWQKRTGDTGTWADISGATSRDYTPVAADVGDQLRCVGAYTDNANSDTSNKNSVESEATNAVVSS